MTPLRRSPRCHWHRGDRLRCFNVTVEACWWIIFRVSAGHWHRGGGLRGVNDTVEAVSAVSLTPWRRSPGSYWYRGDLMINFYAGLRGSLTPWRRSPRCQWHRGGGLCGVIDTVEAVSAGLMTPRSQKWHRGVRQFSYRLFQVAFKGTTRQKKLHNNV